MKLTRCKTCCMPTTRPDTAFVDGECSACVTHKARPTIDWKARREELERIVENLPRNGSGYDCIVPSSGGKDSTWQVLSLIEMGVRPLVVTATTCYLTPIGRRNIDNLAKYATTIEVTPNRTVRAKLNKIGMELVGDISHPEHMAIFSIPFRVARDLGIKTIFYGECPQNAYGGPLGAEQARTMTKRWVSEFGGLLGLRPADFIGMDGITAEDMADYAMPSDEDMQRIDAYFMGQFIPWDSHRNASVAIKHGFEAALPSTANHWTFENLDNATTGLHDHMIWRKYGYGRLCAQLSVDIRNGKMRREQAMAWIADDDGLFPYAYAGVEIDSVLYHLDVTRQWLDEQLDAHTNWDLFAGVEDRRPILKEFAKEAAA